MNLISNTKTVIFDDKVEEIKNLREALDKLLIQNIYIKFDNIESLDEKDEKDKLTNIRYIFTDIIVGDSSAPDSKQAVEPIVNSISENISINNGLFILVIWSNHNTEHQNELIRVLKEDIGYKFFPIKSINKSDYIGESPAKSVESLIEDLKEELSSNLEYFNLLREWESEIQKSSAKVFDLFIDIEDNDKTKDYINGTMKSVLAGLKEPKIADKRKALWTSMNMLMSDTIEKSIVNMTETNELNDELLETLDLTILDENNISTLNSKLIFEIPTNDRIKLYPGNIFCFNSFSNSCDTLKEKICGYDDYKTFFSEDIFEYNKKNTFMTKNTGEDSGDFQTRVKEHLLENIKPILLEFTPYCDYANYKIKKSRLIFGYLVPEDNKCIKKNTDYLYKSPFTFVFKEINYILVLSLRHIIGVNPDILTDLTLLFRARKELVNDIQHNIAYHISRVGVSSL